MEKQSRYPREDNMETQKKTWETPQLIVLARGTPEESVLEGCKTMNPNQSMTGPDQSLQDTCANGPVDKNCSNCQARGVGTS